MLFVSFVNFIAFCVLRTARYRVNAANACECLRCVYMTVPIWWVSRLCENKYSATLHRVLVVALLMRFIVEIAVIEFALNRLCILQCCGNQMIVEVVTWKTNKQTTAKVHISSIHDSSPVSSTSSSCCDENCLAHAACNMLYIFVFVRILRNVSARIYGHTHTHIQTSLNEWRVHG